MFFSQCKYQNNLSLALKIFSLILSTKFGMQLLIDFNQNYREVTVDYT